MGLFIVFEGGEGSGKSTQVASLKRRLSKIGLPVVLTHEPGGTTLGNKVSRLLKRNNNGHISPQAELLLFGASRAEVVSEVIWPGLKQGSVVVCDRYIFSTIAYQGSGRGRDLETIHTINRIATQGVIPDCVILMDIPPEAGLKRLGRGQKDRFENEEMAFHKRVREAYLAMATADPKGWMVVDATLPKKQATELVWHKVERLLQERGMISQ